MYNPQLENGYTKIANETMEALAKHRIPGEQRQVLDVILRKTYGFNKKEDSISNSQFVNYTGLKKGNVSRALKFLVEKNIVIKSDNKRIPTYRFNKYYKTWKVLSKKQPVIKSDNQVLSKAMDTKETITKEKNAYSEDFLNFYSAYPLKKAKQDAFKMWKKHKPPIDICLKAIHAQKLEKIRLKEKKEFCPEWKHPATWINKGCWEDEPYKIPEPKKVYVDV